MIAIAALWIEIQTSLKNAKWATEAKEWPTHSSQPEKFFKKLLRRRFYREGDKN
jgi:hypothetical protein